MRERSPGLTKCKRSTGLLLAGAVLLITACGGGDSSSAPGDGGSVDTREDQQGGGAVRCDAVEAQQDIIRQLMDFDSDRLGSDSVERSVADYLFYWVPEGQPYTTLEYNGWSMGEKSLAELETTLAGDCPVADPSDICERLAENRRALIAFKGKVRGQLSGLVVTSEDSATGESTCTAQVRFDVPGVSDKAIEYALTYAAQPTSAGGVETRRLKPRSHWEQQQGERQQAMAERARRYNHDGAFLKPGGLFCLTINALPRAAAIELANNPAVQDPGPMCDFSGQEYTPLVEITEVMTPTYVRAKIKSTGKYLWTTRRNLVSGIDGVPVVEPLLNDGRAIEHRMVREVPTVLQGAGRCARADGAVAYEISASRLRLGERDCSFESGASSGANLYATMHCSSPGSDSSEEHVRLFRIHDGSLDIEIAGEPTCTVPADGVVPENVAAAAQPAIEPPAPSEAPAAPPPPAEQAEAVAADPVEPVIVPPKVIRKTAPEYPPSARRKMETGVVSLRVEVLPTGRVGAVEVENSSGSAALDEAAAAEAKKGWRFEPGTVDGVPQSTWFTTSVTFSLN